MQLSLGAKIRELRHRDGRTQEALAEALGVTSQAVSRWEANGSYPDMEIIPSIANYFGVSIDELFGYQNDRDKKVNAIIETVRAYHIESRSDDEWIDECVAIIREGLAEFPNNELLMITLAEALWEAGWRRHNDWGDRYDEDGFIRYQYDTQKTNPYWCETEKLCDTLLESAKDYSVYTRAMALLVPLCRNFGKTEKAISYAKRMPRLRCCQEYLLTEATDGKQEAKYIGEFLLNTAKDFSEQLVFGLIAERDHYNTDMPMEKVQGAIALFDLLCDDGNMGVYHADVTRLYLYLSRLQWERGYHDDAFVSLDRALAHAKAFETASDGEEHTLTAPLVCYVTFCVEPSESIVKSLPSDWPFWCNPDYSQAEREIKADPRWQAWVEKTQQ